MDEIFYKGESGRAIQMYTGFDWTNATDKRVDILMPSKARLRYGPAQVVVDDAPTGQIHIYIDAAFTETGTYLLQASATVSGVIRYGPVVSLILEERLYNVGTP